MQKLILAGLGLSKEDITLKTLEKAGESKEVFYETYTSKVPGVNKKYLEKVFGKEVKKLSRSDLEKNFPELIDRLEGEILILVPGDPLVFTTHLNLLIEAKKRGIQTEIIHAPSVYSAIGESGLFLYKFGKSTTLPYPLENFKPESPYECIKENMERGLHTLALLDIKEEKKKYLTPKEGLEYLLELESRKSEGVISKEQKVVILSQIGSNTKALYDKISKLLKSKINPPSIIIFPGKLHSIEKEYLEKFL